MTEFAVTFGQKYARDRHPSFPGAHPDGYVIIVADDFQAARACAIAHFGVFWCDLYGPDTWESSRRYFPAGELARFTAGEVPQ
jgi:hypothetical protein